MIERIVTTLIAILGLALISCTREASQPSVLKITLPSHTPLSIGKTKFNSQSSQGWELTDFAVISEVKCYALLIKNKSSSKPSRACTNEGTEVFSANEFHGLYTAGSNINLQTSSGSDQTIYLVGLATNGACTDLQASSFNKALFSKPRLIGRKTLDIIPGNNVVSITASMSGSQLFDDCAGPAFGTPSTEDPPPEAQPTYPNTPHLHMTGPAKISSGACVPIRVTLMDGEHVGATTSTDHIIDFSSASGSFYGPYDTTCTTAQSQLTIYSGSNSDKLHYLATAGFTGDTITTQLSGYVDGSLTLTAGDGSNQAVASEVSASVDSIMTLNNCYLISVGVKNINGESIKAPSNIDFIYSSTGGTFFSTPSCTGQPLSGQRLYSNNYFLTAYFKPHVTGSGSLEVGATGLTSAINTFDVIVASSSPVVARSVSLSKSFVSLGANECGRLNLSLKDINGKYVQAKMNTTVTLSGLGTAANVYSDSSCLSALPGASLTFAVNEAFKELYYKTSTAQTVSALTAEAPGLTADTESFIVNAYSPVSWISPSLGVANGKSYDLAQFVVAGIPPYSFSHESGVGNFSDSKVSFSSPGTGVFRVTDGASNTADISIEAHASDFEQDFTSALSGLTFTRASPGTYFDSSGVLQSASTNQSRVDYDPITHLPRGLLMEKSSTNLLNYTEDFDQTIWKSSTSVMPTLTTNSAIAPDGTMTADLISDQNRDQFNADQLARLVQPIVNTHGSGSYVFSIYLKANTSDVILLWQRSVTDSASNSTVFDLTRGLAKPYTSYSSSSATYKRGIEPAGNGWWRVWVQSDLVSGVSWTKLNLMPAFAPDFETGATNGTQGSVYAWGAQFEKGKVPTSYIPNPVASPSTVTRSTELLTNSGSLTGMGILSSSGTFFIDWESRGEVNSDQYLLNLDTTASDKHEVKVNSSNSPHVEITTASTSAYSYIYGTNLNASGLQKISYSYGAGNCSTALNNSPLLSTTTSSCSVPSSLSNMKIGSDLSGTNQMIGHLRKISYWDQAFSEPVLREMTKPSLFPGDYKPTFASNGWDAQSLAHNSEIVSMKVQSDGKVVAAGNIGGTPTEIVVIRYLANGTLDTSFDGDGKRQISLAGNSSVKDLHVYPDGKVLLAGKTFNGGSGEDVLLVKLNPDGSYDSGFGSGGKVISTLSSGNDLAQTLIVSGGKIIIGGQIDGHKMMIAKYEEIDGSIDTSWGAAGVASHFISGLTLMANSMAFKGSDLVLFGYSQGGVNKDFAMAAFDSTGAISNNVFGTGFFKIDLGKSGEEYLKTQSLRIGYDTSYFSIGQSEYGKPFLLKMDGYLGFDNTFGTYGKITLPAFSEVYDLAVTETHVYVVGKGQGTKALIARYNITGVVDINFGSKGFVSFDQTGTSVYKAVTVHQATKGVFLGGFWAPSAQNDSITVNLAE
ncbi:hypothetical protein GW916_05825 [bacterium]|nr:hypothetical protein [bacterium]